MLDHIMIHKMNLKKFIFKKILLKKIPHRHNLKITILTLLSIQLSSDKYIHVCVTDLQNFFILQIWNSPFNNFPFILPLSPG